VEQRPLRVHVPRARHRQRPVDLPPTNGHRRAGVRPDEVQPKVRPLATTRTIRGALGVAPSGCDAQPLEAPQPPDRRRRRLNEPGGERIGPATPGRLAARRSTQIPLSDSHPQMQERGVGRWRADGRLVLVPSRRELGTHEDARFRRSSSASARVAQELLLGFVHTGIDVTVGQGASDCSIRRKASPAWRRTPAGASNNLTRWRQRTRRAGWGSESPGAVSGPLGRGSGRRGAPSRTPTPRARGR
jgi:hypothetical protein